MKSVFITIFLVVTVCSCLNQPDSSISDDTNSPEGEASTVVGQTPTRFLCSISGDQPTVSIEVDQDSSQEDDVKIFSKTFNMTQIPAEIRLIETKQTSEYTDHVIQLITQNNHVAISVHASGTLPQFIQIDSRLTGNEGNLQLKCRHGE